jgi:AraC family transcriptional regulator
MTDSSQPVHPSDLIPESWVMETMTIGAGGLVVRHQFEQPSELAVPALTHHLIAVNIGQQGTRQITRFGRQEYDETFPTGSLWLATADNTACEWTWETTDETILFQIDPLYFQEIAAENGCANSERLELKPVVFDRNPRFESIARNFHAEMQQQGLGGKLYSESLGNLFMLDLLRTYCQDRSQPQQVNGGLGEKRLQRVLAYIDAHLAENIGLQDMASAAGLGQYHFATMFKQSMNISPYRYVIEQRIDRAKRQLRQQEVAIIDIALACGFADQSHLTKHFRKFVGVTPRAFRSC